jgi:hypothetical protein
MSVCVVNVDKGNNEGVYDDVLDIEKIVTRMSRRQYMVEAGDCHLDSMGCQSTKPLEYPQYLACADVADYMQYLL